MRAHLPWLAVATAFNCTESISPEDVSPFRSPQVVHTFLARRFNHKDVVEIGTRNGDAIACFAQTARSVVGIEKEAHYCRRLVQRAQQMHRAGTGSFRIVCDNYERVTLPTADVYTWWQHPPHLLDGKVLERLKDMRKRVQHRYGAQAVVLFDMSWRDDVRSLHKLRSIAAWSASIPYDEIAMCMQQGKHMCERAKGTFVVLGIPLNNL